MIIFLFALPILILLLSIGIYFDIPLFVTGIGFVLTMALYCVAPAIYFALSDKLISKLNSRPSKKTTVLLAGSFLLYIASEIVFFCAVFGSSRVLSFYLTQRIIWCVLCGVVIMANGAVKRRCDAKAFKTVIVTEGIAALLINALAVKLLSPLSPPSVDGFDAVLLIGGAFVLSVALINAGKQLSGKLWILEACLWFAGVLASFFIELYIIGTPPTPPIVDARHIVAWVGLSVITFVGFLVGVVLKAIKKQKFSKWRSKKQTEAI